MFWAHTPAAWAAIGTWVYAGLTLLLAGAAGAAAVFTFRQMRAGEGQLREARQTRVDSVRPVMVVPKASLLAPTAGASERAIEVQLRNVGSGPAIELEVIAWVSPIPPGVTPQRIAAWNDAIEKAETQLQSASPTGTAQLVGMAAGEAADLYCLRKADNSLFWNELSDREGAFVFVAVRWEDIYGNEFRYPEPSAPGKLKFIRRGAVLSKARFVEPP